MRRPVLSVAISAGILLILAIPVLSMKTGNGALDQFPKDHDVVVGVELVDEATGGGADPIRVVADFGAAGAGGAAERRPSSRPSGADFGRDQAVAAVGDWPSSADGGTALLDDHPRGAEGLRRRRSTWSSALRDR